MNTTELKQLLFNKLQAEQTTFKKSDIHISKINENKYTITLKDFEPFSFKLNLSTEDITISKYYNNEFCELVTLADNTNEAILYLGYYIATRF